MNTLETQNAPGLSHHGAQRNNNSDPSNIAQSSLKAQELAPRNVRETIAWLLRLERPPLPENPIEAAKQGKEPKQPCFLDGKGYFKSVNWKHWQNTQPNQEIIDAWFCNPKTGIGTLGGWNGKHWLGWTDFDLKDFSSAQDCDRSISQWMEQYPVAQTAPMFRTPSGGYRFLFAFEREPENFKANSGFSLAKDGSHHCGELLCKNGGHTLLPPTMGLNGEAYCWVQWSEYPPVADSPEEIGLYPLVKKTEVKPIAKAESHQCFTTVNSNQSLSELLENEIYPRLNLEQAFNWTGHDFQVHGNKLKGNCPWHDSQSGTAFYCERTQNGLLWRCPACNIGGSVISYRHRLRGGNGSPKGRDFVELVKELADETGVAMPVLQAQPITKELSAHNSKSNSNPVISSANKAANLDYIREKFIELLVSGASKTQVEQFKLSIRQQYSLLHPSELNNFLSALTEEFHLGESLEDEAVELQKLISAGEQTINLADYLPSSLADPLAQYCEWQKIRHAVILTSLLTTVSSLHKVGTELVIHSNLNFKVPPTIFGAIIAESGSKKSPIFRATAREPLNILKEEEQLTHLADSEIYQSELEEWETAKAELKRGERMSEPRPVEPKPPTIFYFTDATGEALKAQAQKAPEKSLFGLIDELAGLFSSQNAYRGGRGSDKQDLLSYFDGTGATVLRAGGVKVDVSRIYLSLLGTIQPDILKKHIGNLKDADGSWSRWLYAVQPNVPSTLEDDTPLGVDITDYLAGLYRRIHNLPAIKYRLSHQAFKLYQPFYNRLEQLRVSHPLPGLRAVYAKAEGYVGRLAMNLHVLHELECNRTPDPVIPVERMREAIELMKFFIGQVRLIHASVEDSDSIAPHIQKVIELSKRKQLGGETGWIKAKDVQLNSTRSQRPSPNEARNWMSQAASLGYGSLKGEGIRLEFKANTQKVDAEDNGRRKVDSLSTCESIEISSFQPKVDKVDTYSPSLFTNPIVDKAKVDEAKLQNLVPKVDDWNCQTVETMGLLCLPKDQTPQQSNTSAVDNTTTELSTECLPSTFEQEEQVVTSVASLESSTVEQTSTPNTTATTNRAIVKGSRVRVRFPGSKRNGLEGVVIGFRTEQGLQKAIVKLENIEASLRIWECFVPGNEGMRLELVS
jgi:hypothetical protein